VQLIVLGISADKAVHCLSLVTMTELGTKWRRCSITFSMDATPEMCWTFSVSI